MTTRRRSGQQGPWALWLIRRLGRHLRTGALDELTLTTNGSQLSRYAGELVDGVRRINVSLDTLDARKFKDITLWGRFEQVMEGIQAANDANGKPVVFIRQ